MILDGVINGIEKVGGIMTHTECDIVVTDMSDVEKEIYSKREEVRYDVRDMTVEAIANKYNDSLDDKNQSETYNYIYVPEYQRDFVWSEDRQSRLIESIIMGLPIPFIFVAENSDSSWEIVDGSQRVRTIHAFINDRLKLKHLEAIKSLNGYRFSDLKPSRQGKILNTALRIIVLSEETTDSVKTDMFERINRGSDLLKPMETRRGGAKGRFISFVEECARDKLFNTLAPVSKMLERRREREELILRFFAISDKEIYKTGINKGVAAFLDEYYKEKNDEWNSMDDEQYKKTCHQYKVLFEGVNKYVKEVFPYGFRRSRNLQTQRSTFEAISVGVCMAINSGRINYDLNKDDVMEIISSSKFKDYVQGASESHRKKKLNGRIMMIYELVSK